MPVFETAFLFEARFSAYYLDSTLRSVTRSVPLAHMWANVVLHLTRAVEGEKYEAGRVTVSSGEGLLSKAGPKLVIALQSSRRVSHLPCLKAERICIYGRSYWVTKLIVTREWMTVQNRET